MDEKFELRLVCYPVTANNQVVNQYGFFNVSFQKGRPVEGLPIDLKMVGDNFEQVMSLSDQLADAVYIYETLYCYQTVDKNTWNGTLKF